MADQDQPIETRPAMLSSLPLWVQAVSLVGFPILVAGFYMLKDVGYLPSMAEVNAKSIQEILSQHRDQTGVLSESLRLQRIACYRGAQTQVQHRECTE